MKENSEKLKVLYTVLNQFDDYYERDNKTAKHSKRVEELATHLSNKLDIINLNGYSKEIIRLVGKYHDIGKYWISDKLLDEKEELSEEEWKEVVSHNFIAYTKLVELLLKEGCTREEILEGIIGDFLMGIHDSHEKIGGGGYFGKKNKEDIHILARMISVMDHYDSMTQPHTPGEKGRTKEQAILELRLDEGLDQDYVEEFVKIIKV